MNEQQHKPIELEELEAIEQRANAATPGPWPLDVDWATEPDDTLLSWACGPQHSSRVNDRSQAAKDATFIANARQDVPALVAEVKRLRAALQTVIDFQPPVYFADLTDERPQAAMDFDYFEQVKNFAREALDGEP